MMQSQRQAISRPRLVWRTTLAALYLCCGSASRLSGSSGRKSGPSFGREGRRSVLEVGQAGRSWQGWALVEGAAAGLATFGADESVIEEKPSVRGTTRNKVASNPIEG